MLDPQEKLIEAAANRPKRDELLDCLRLVSHLMHGLAMKMQELEEREDNFLRCKRTIDEQETRKNLWILLKKWASAISANVANHITTLFLRLY